MSRRSPTPFLRKTHGSSQSGIIITSAKHAVFPVVLFLSLLITRLLTTTTPSDDSLSVAELQNLVQRLQSDDNRLMRWNATPHTRREREKGACQELPLAMQQLVASTDNEWQVLASEYATFCITDNPTERQHFAEVKNIHQTLVKLLSSKSSLLSAKAAHVIYISAFANKNNQEGFYKAGAVQTLSEVIKSDMVSPLQLMWAAAALQNLAASYCDTPGNGRCSWKWNSDEAYVKVKDFVISDGSLVRKAALNDSRLVTRLVQLSCRGPVQGRMADDNPFPGHNAIAGKHNEATNIVAWAATGALKNLALEPEGATVLHKDTVCFCRLAHSRDWLEKNKGNGLLHHIRHADPCWFANKGKGDDYQHGGLCIDREFLDQGGYRCDDYGKATTAECRATDVHDSSSAANVSCCGCGGGDKYVDSLKQQL